MNPTLYFLRSSEAKIAKNILPYAMRLDEIGKTLEEVPELEIFEKNYGLYNSDLGLYALVENKIAGAVWLRKFESKKSNAFIDGDTPILNIALKPEFRGQCIGYAMMKQLLLEAGTIYKQISVSVVSDSRAIKFYEKLGFVKVQRDDEISPIDGCAVITMLKKLDIKEVVRPSDGYDPRRWMD